MAAGDFTYDEGVPRRAGNVFVITGTMEVDDSLTAFALADTKSRILSATVENMDGVGATRILLNADASAVSTMGTISVDGENSGPETHNYRVEYV